MKQVKHNFKCLSIDVPPVRTMKNIFGYKNALNKKMNHLGYLPTVYLFSSYWLATIHQINVWPSEQLQIRRGNNFLAALLVEIAV